MFVRAPNPIWYLPDLEGLPLNDEYFAFFLTNTLPYLPQNVFMDNQGTSVWTNDIVQFFPNGTLPDNLFFDPNLVYRIEIRHGNTQNDALIYEINDFVPGIPGSDVDNPFPILFAENQISNPNFANVNFSSNLSSSEPTATFTVAGTYSIAPGWDLILSGSGSTTVKQKIFNPVGVNNFPNAINFALEIASTGWTSVFLRQRFNNNGAIFSGGAINASLVGEGVSGSNQIAVNYTPSDTGTAFPIIQPVTLPFGVFGTVSRTINLPASVNTDLSNVAYVDILITLPANGTVRITDVQVVGQDFPIDNSLLSVINPEYQQITEERNIDHLFHYYKNATVSQAKDSLLTGWNFSLNPWQFTTRALTNVATNTYTADQTIIVQQAYVTSATGNNVAVGRATNANNFDFVVQAVTAHNQFAMIQFIDPATIAEAWSRKVSSMVKAYINTTHATTLALKMRLFFKAGLPSMIGQNSPIASWTEGSDPVLASGYTAIVPPNDPVFLVNSGTEQIFSFNGIQLPASTDDNMTLGIMIYSISNMSITGTPDAVFFHDISLVRNDFALATQPMTFEQSLYKCQYYYEKSYSSEVLPGAGTPNNEIFAEQLAIASGGFLLVYARGFSFRYQTTKRAVPLLSIYSAVSGAINNVDAVVTDGVNLVNSGAKPISNWILLSSNTKGFNYKGGTTMTILSPMNPATVPEGYIHYHYSADARLGV